jgi:predicted RNA binding protein YcfA (HicA-like mRNA interferase family)
MPKLPGVRYKDAIRVLEKAGWRVIREGKHTIVALPVLRSSKTMGDAMWRLPWPKNANEG